MSVVVSSSPAHMKTDVDGLHSRICHLMAMSRKAESADTDTLLASAVNADKIRLERRNACLVIQLYLI